MSEHIGNGCAGSRFEVFVVRPPEENFTETLKAGTVAWNVRGYDPGRGVHQVVGECETITGSDLFHLARNVRVPRERHRLDQ